MEIIMPFFKSAALIAIKTFTKVDSPMAVAAVRKIIIEYGLHVPPENLPENSAAKKDFYKLMNDACHVVMKTQNISHSAGFLVEMLDSMHESVPKSILTSSSTAYDKEIVANALYNFARNKTDTELLKRAFDAFLEIGTWDAYDNAIEIFGQDNERAQVLIDNIMQSEVEHQDNLLASCYRKNDSSKKKKKIFAALCELSKSEEGKVAEPAEDLAVKMFYEYRDGEYSNIADLAPVFEDIAKKNSIPVALKHLFNKISDPEKELEAYVEARALRNAPENSEKPDTTINLMAVFERVDKRNAENGQATNMAEVYGKLRSAVLLRKEAVDIHVMNCTIGDK